MLKKIIVYFFRGALFVVPLALTVYLIAVSISEVDSWIPIDIPGIGLLLILTIITLVGYLSSWFITKPIFDFFERLLTKVPLFNILYTSIKDLISAFVGDNKRFNSPVIVSMDNHSTLKKPGFITQEDLIDLTEPGMVAVYLPHSFNFSGNIFLVDKKHVKTVNVNSADFMKFIVSGGASNVPKVLEKAEKEKE